MKITSHPVIKLPFAWIQINCKTETVYNDDEDNNTVVTTITIEISRTESAKEKKG